MKKIFIVLAFIFVGMANAMQSSLLDGSGVRHYVYNDPEEIAYLNDIEDLYKRIQQEDVQSCTQEAVQSKGCTEGPRIEEIFSFLAPVQNHEQDLVNIFGLNAVNKIDHSQKSSAGNPYLTGHEKNEVSVPLILGFLQEASVENDEEQQGRAIADRQEKELESMQFSFLWQPEEKSKSRKRTLEEAASSDEKNRDKEPVVSNTSKKVARKSSTSSKNMEICGINGCQYHATVSRHMKDHKQTEHEQKQCPYPGCTFHLQSRGELLQHIKENHSEKCCNVCGYSPRERGDLLKHLQRAKHGSVSKNPAFINFKLG